MSKTCNSAFGFGCYWCDFVEDSVESFFTCQEYLFSQNKNLFLLINDAVCLLGYNLNVTSFKFKDHSELLLCENIEIFNKLIKIRVNKI